VIEPSGSLSDDTGARSRDFVQSLERGLAIIRAFSAERPALTVSELAEETGLTRAAVRRFVLTLGEMGYVYAKHNRFELSPRILELGYAYLSALSFPEIALPHLEAVVASTGEASEAALLDGDEVVYVLRVPGPSMMTIAVNIGARAPAYATSLGRVLLAHLPSDELEDFLRRADLAPVLPRTIADPDDLRAELKRVREQGYAVVDQELELGLAAIAVPVRDRLGRVRAAINLSTHTGRRSAEELARLVPQLQAAAAEVEVGVHDAALWRD
jgi:IclR family pca regulon transcriptional regulator